MTHANLRKLLYMIMSLKLFSNFGIHMAKVPTNDRMHTPGQSFNDCKGGVCILKRNLDRRYLLNLRDAPIIQTKYFRIQPFRFAFLFSINLPKSFMSKLIPSSKNSFLLLILHCSAQSARLYPSCFDSNPHSIIAGLARCSEITWILHKTLCGFVFYVFNFFLISEDGCRVDMIFMVS